MTNPFGLAPPSNLVMMQKNSRKPIAVGMFLCPCCGNSVRPQNTLAITCGTCGMSGTKDHFSSIIVVPDESAVAVIELDKAA